jgi:NAD(P)-dependent dehydrogenase (short-subunit alcohol dehydrogenase family)
MPSATPIDQPVAVVTGAGSGIGRAIAKDLSRRGYALVLAGRTLASLEATKTVLQARAVCMRTDVARDDECERLIDETVSQFGRLDALVNCAGFAPMTPLVRHEAPLIRRVFEVNAIGPALLMVSAWRVFERQRLERPDSDACIVNISSMAGIDPFPGFFAYAGAKAALNLMTTVADKEGRDLGIRCFSICPGAVETPMLRAIFDESTVPRDKALHPDHIAAIVGQCVVGLRDRDVGKIITVPSADYG